MTLRVPLSEYEALVAWARRGAVTPDDARDLESLLEQIERGSGIVRHRLWVQWQEPDAPLPARVAFPNVWPPELRCFLEFLSRPIARADVEHALRIHARSPVHVLVTPDPAGVLGWTPLDRYFVQ